MSARTEYRISGWTITRQWTGSSQPDTWTYEHNDLEQGDKLEVSRA